jgi:HPt (histidine-containing phosphotransfer) domain-containing protein
VMVTELVRLYLSDSPALIEQIQQAIAVANTDNLRRAAHTLKGNSSQLGMMTLSERSAELENLAKSGSTDGAEGMLERIQNEFERVDFSLKMAFLDESKPQPETKRNVEP